MNYFGTRINTDDVLARLFIENEPNKSPKKYAMNTLNN